VYDRPRGDVAQEMGGVLMTAYVMCAGSLGEDPMNIFQKELRRVLKKTPEEFAKRNTEKMSLVRDDSKAWKVQNESAGNDDRGPA
jgi:hypothetical protein